MCVPKIGADPCVSPYSQSLPVLKLKLQAGNPYNVLKEETMIAQNSNITDGADGNQRII